MTEAPVFTVRPERKPSWTPGPAMQNELRVIAAISTNMLIATFELLTDLEPESASASDTLGELRSAAEQGRFWETALEMVDRKVAAKQTNAQ